MSVFWKIVKLVIIGFFEIIWILIAVTFYYLPMFIINYFRRIHIKNKIQRQLMKDGMSRNQAKKVSQIYKKHLFDYSSLRGILNLTKLGVKYSRSLKSNERIEKTDNKKIMNDIAL